VRCPRLERPANSLVKKNKEPQNVAHVKKMVRKYKEQYKGITWVPCIVCGDLCPQSKDREPYCRYDSVHMTCTLDETYPARVKELKKQRAEEAKISLF